MRNLKARSGILVVALIFASFGFASWSYAQLSWPSAAGVKGIKQLADLDFYTGQTFAKNAALSVGKNWSADRLIELSPKEAKESMILYKEQIAQTCLQLEKKLGQVKAVKSIHFLRQEQNKDGLQQSFQLKLDCALASATVTSVIRKSGDSWRLLRFVVRSEKLADLMAPDQEELRFQCEEMLPSICKNWQTEDLTPLAASRYKEELKNNPIVQQAVLNSVKGLGHYQQIEELCGAQKTVIDGLTVYIVQCRTKFEHGSAFVWLHLVEEESNWRLHRFNIQASSTL